MGTTLRAASFLDNSITGTTTAVAHLGIGLADLDPDYPPEDAPADRLEHVLATEYPRWRGIEWVAATAAMAVETARNFLRERLAAGAGNATTTTGSDTPDTACSQRGLSGSSRTLGDRPRVDALVTRSSVAVRLQEVPLVPHQLPDAVL